VSAPNKFSGCSSCINKLCDPDQCASCEDESNWEGADDTEAQEDTIETLSLDELKNLIGGR
jgi:hypothetical protein